ncbi:MAG: hypothetical protein ACTSV8_04490 [Candidatus Thorarchaeota archaeon]
MITKFAPEADVFFSESKVSRCEGCPALDILMRSFLQLADMRLTDTQKTVLRVSAEVLRFHELTMTALADMVSRRTGIPYSTVKWNLRSLADLGLINGGNHRSRGRKAELTGPATMLVRYLTE